MTEWPADVVEAVARSLHGCDAYLDAIAALSTLSPAAAAVARGEAVAVPKEIIDALWADLPYLMGRASAEGHDAGQRLAQEWRDKLAASPYAEKKPTP